MVQSCDNGVPVHLMSRYAMCRNSEMLGCEVANSVCMECMEHYLCSIAKQCVYGALFMQHC